MKINSSPTPRKLYLCPCSTFINKQWYQKRLEIRPCWVPNPQQGVATVTMEAKGTLSSSVSHVPKIGTTMCFPYPATQVSNSWHTQDGFFLHERKGAVKWWVHHYWKVILLHTLFWGTIHPERLNQHMTSAFDKSKTWTRIVLDFRTNNNIKKFMLWSI